MAYGSDGTKLSGLAVTMKALLSVSASPPVETLNARVPVGAPAGMLRVAVRKFGPLTFTEETVTPPPKLTEVVLSKWVLCPAIATCTGPEACAAEAGQVDVR